MSVIRYKGSNGAYTDDPNGFLFSLKTRHSRTQVYGGDVLGNYSSALGGWAHQCGSWSSLNNGNYYKTSGEYYSQGSIGWVGQGIGVTDYGHVVGSITSVMAYDIGYSITTKGLPNSVGGSVSGTGRYESGSTVRVKATAYAGYVLTSLTGLQMMAPSKETEESVFTASSDMTVVAEFQKVYNVKFNANGGDEDSVPVDTVDHFYNSGSSQYDSFSLPTDIPTRRGWTFTGWAKTKTGAVVYRPGQKVSNLTSSNSITLYAVWTQYSITFSFRDGETGAPVPEVVKGAQGDVVVLPGPSDTMREKHVLRAWLIDGVEYDAGSDYALPNKNVTAVAVWKYVYFDISIANRNPAAGTISLVRDGETVATEASGVLSYEGPADAVYEVICELKDRLHIPLGIAGEDGYFKSFAPSEGDSLSYSYEFRKKATFSIGLDFDRDRGEVSVETPPDETVDGVDRWLEGDVEIAVVPASSDGWKFKIANVVDADNISRGSYTSLKDGRFTLPLSFDSTVRVQFERARYSYGADIDGPSGDAVSTVSASSADEGGDGKVEHGKRVLYTADVRDGYLFAGWYDGDSLVSEDNPYDHELKKDTVLTAKAKVSVSLSVQAEEVVDRNAPVLFVDGEAREGGSYDGHVTLGESISYRLDGNGWFFDSWYDGGTAVSLPTEGTLTPSSKVGLVARFTATQVTRRLTVVAMRTSDGLAISQSGLIDAGVAPERPSGGGLQGVPSPGTYSFVFTGTQYVKVSAQPTAEGLAFNFFASSLTDEGVPNVESVLSREGDYVFLLNKDTTVYACYGDLSDVDTTFAFANGSDRTMGEFSADGGEASPDGSVTVTAKQQSTISVTARAKNGYEFAGWYSDAGHIGDPLETGTTSEIKVTSQRTLYAAFRKNRHAVYEWEGSSDNKMMEWRSKVYVAPAPFNPSAARVDATGYSVNLEVGMYSSPSGRPVRKATIVIEDQDPRRLPALRPERYMQVCVKNDAEVDSVVVGTSMGGLLS